MKNSAKITDLRGLCVRVVCLNSPHGTSYLERQPIIDMAHCIMSASPCVEFMMVQEVSRIIARITYREWRHEGWRKKKEGKTVSWKKDAVIEFRDQNYKKRTTHEN